MTALFDRNRAEVLAAIAAECGCSVETFATNMLAVVPKPAGHRPATAFLASAGTGTVIAVAEPYLDWARANAPAPHPRAYFPEFLSGLVSEGARRGERLLARPANLCFTSGEVPTPPAVPAGLTLTRHASAWMAEQRQSAVFHNALGADDDAGADERALFALALHDADGPVAIAGVYRALVGLDEIGVDVLRRARGRGLAQVVVSAATRAILDSGNAPFYTCAPTNIRSQRTALGSGYLPVASCAAVGPAEPSTPSA